MTLENETLLSAFPYSNPMIVEQYFASMCCTNSVYLSYGSLIFFFFLQEHKDSLPTFMGMPLYGLKKDKEEKKKELEREEDKSGLEDFGDAPEVRGLPRNGPYGESGPVRSWRR